jgi:hypothetical protein
MTAERLISGSTCFVGTFEHLMTVERLISGSTCFDVNVETVCVVLVGQKRHGCLA